MVDLTGEVARAAGAAAAIRAVKRYFIAIFIKHMQNGSVRRYLEGVPGGRHSDAESCVLGGAHQYLLGAGRYCERYDPFGRRPSVVFSQVGATVRIHEIIRVTVGQGPSKAFSLSLNGALLDRLLRLWGADSDE